MPLSHHTPASRTRARWASRLGWSLIGFVGFGGGSLLPLFALVGFDVTWPPVAIWWGAVLVGLTGAYRADLDELATTPPRERPIPELTRWI